jgi:hypothetical protein
MTTAATLTDAQIRDEWNHSGLTLDEDCYYALKRNARMRIMLQGDDDFSLFCEWRAAHVAARINRRSGAV